MSSLAKTIHCLDAAPSLSGCGAQLVGSSALCCSCALLGYEIEVASARSTRASSICCQGRKDFLLYLLQPKVHSCSGTSQPPCIRAGDMPRIAPRRRAQLRRGAKLATSLQHAKHFPALLLLRAGDMRAIAQLGPSLAPGFGGHCIALALRVPRMAPGQSHITPARGAKHFPALPRLLPGPQLCHRRDGLSLRNGVVMEMMMRVRRCDAAAVARGVVTAPVEH